MSGIVGIFHRDGAPAPARLVKALTDFLSFRGPDRATVWSDGPVALGQTLLKTTFESEIGDVVANSEHNLWIATDVRIDCRSELEATLHNAGRRIPNGSNDPQLILEAYEVWGEECVRYLRGDFAFVIWDSRRKNLFCARDHFGVKPFYYAEYRDFFLFSNTLNCVLLHPRVSDQLNEEAIADFLLFGLNCDVSTTTFRDVRRLPPAHFLSVSADKFRIGRYWSAPVDGNLRYRNAEDYVRNFRSLLQMAVKDRMRTDRAGILLSGGLDSAAIGATARKLSEDPGGKVKLYAYTNTYESLLPDPDKAHARTTAAFLGIPIRCVPLDNLELFDRWNDPAVSWPEPIDDPLSAGLFDLFKVIAGDCRIALSGEGSDNLMLFQMIPHLKYLLGTRQPHRAMADLLQYLRVRRIPWRGLRRLAKRIVGRDSLVPRFPEWIAPDFARRIDLKRRWKDLNQLLIPQDAHPTFPKAHASLSLPHWQRLFELSDPGLTHCPVEVRYPFLDLRVVNYLLAIPPYPWAYKKRLLREAMSANLPDSTRLRPKTAFEGDPVLKKIQLPESAWISRMAWCDEIDRYVNRSVLLPQIRHRNPTKANLSLRPLCLNFWLQSRSRVQYKLPVEASHG